MGMQA